MFPMELQNHIRNPQRRRVTTSTSSWVNFTPLALNPYVWFDAADTSTITSSAGAVSQWNDKSGLGRDLTQATGSAQPATGTNTLNGLNVINFNGTSHGLIGPSFTIPLWQHVYAVVRPTGFPNAYNSVVSHESLGNGYTLIPKSNGKLAVYESNATGNTSYDGTGATTLAANTAYSLEYSWNGFQLFSYVNRISDATVTKTLTIGTASSALRIGHSFFASRWWQGDIAEVVIFTNQLSVYGQTAMRNYLNAKWAIY